MSPTAIPSAIRSVIVGTGFMGDVHARAVRASGGTVAAVVSRSADQAAAAATRFGAESAYTALEQALNGGQVDVVHICTPNHTHLELAHEAIAAGVHVICEKPLATSTSDAEDLEAAATAAGVVHAIPFAYRFYGSVREARARVLASPKSSVRIIHGSYLQDWLSRPDDTNWRVDPALGGHSRAFGDIGVHWCDLVEFVTGHRIARVSAQLLALPRTGAGGSGTEDAAVIQFVTDHGAIGSSVISQISPGRKNRLWFSIDTADASYQFDQEDPDSLWIGGRGHNVELPRAAEDQVIGPHYDLVPAGHPQGYQDCFTNFVRDVHRAVRGERPDGLPTFADGLRAAALTDAVLESARTGAWVEPTTPRQGVVSAAARR
ncbi:Gfo/Idh/MocA family protein [Phycicoccus sp. Soil802]|uniref:Gfo/Idh/MocA family protein n=1 Tax=Phycicoccus sp. Soil802 TaxID=1736414 RepID=UPI000702F0C4|nr:Gfo/Idh/MocA family oxidoreductase [Phycicoccus sp. Soil802]KRF22357.1 oxidoreductase [Phycicoccus sp. Soil802]